MGVQGDKSKQCSSEVLGEADPLPQAMERKGEGNKKIRAYSQELVRLVGKLFDD